MSLSSLVTPSADRSGTSARGIAGWLLPVGLVLGFLLVFAILFGERLLPKVEVRTSQVVTLRGAGSATTSSTASHQLLFQASGWLEPDPYAIQVPALVNGIVNEVYVLEGQSVEKGDLLATLVDDEAKLNLEKADRNLTAIRSNIAAHCSQVPEVKARLASARAKVEAEKARLAELSDTANRLKNLSAGAASLSEVNTALMQLSRQQAFVKEAETEIPRLEAELSIIDYQRVAMGNAFLEAESGRDLAKLAYDRHRITAPSDGRVLALYAQPGKKRMLNMDEPTSALIVELYQPTKMQARIDVPLNEAAGLAVGQEVELTTDLLNDVTLNGIVTRITGEADLARNTLQAKVAITNPDDRLRPEMLVRAKFYPAVNETTEPTKDPKANERLLIMAPMEAFFEIKGLQAKAWVVSTRSTAELRTIELGNSEREGFREVSAGLRSGEQLILPPFEKLTAGSRLSVTPTQL